MIRRSFLLAVVCVASLLAYVRLMRPWHLRWGASDEEVQRPMPLDERIPSPDSVSTRAVTIGANPAAVWPWIVQIGESPRAGFYSYALVERLQGMQIENSERILPEFQELHVGEAVDGKGDILVLAVEPEQYLVLGPPEKYDWLKSTWAFVLLPADGATRLVTRVRAKVNWLGLLKNTPPISWPFLLLIDPGVFIMERKMLLEIKRLAEHSAQSLELRLTSSDSKQSEGIEA